MTYYTVQGNKFLKIIKDIKGRLRISSVNLDNVSNELTRLIKDVDDVFYEYNIELNEYDISPNNKRRDVPVMRMDAILAGLRKKNVAVGSSIAFPYIPTQNLPRDYTRAINQFTVAGKASNSTKAAGKNILNLMKVNNLKNSKVNAANEAKRKAAEENARKVEAKRKAANAAMKAEAERKAANEAKRQAAEAKRQALERQVLIDAIKDELKRLKGRIQNKKPL